MGTIVSEKEGSVRAAMRVCKPIAVRYGETDMMGIVYHANYLLYFEDARTASSIRARSSRSA
ncbi:MAG: hypothetical protein RSB04_09300 [Gordonibacter sp.]|uniref:acyl-CoA thioesterase n=1 Tax=Gordonibacter sp. TaxID=1968902 RepID=UPI002FCB5A50